MRVGIFGAADDPQCQTVGSELRRLGAEPVLIRADALDRGLPIAFDDDRTYYLDRQVDDLAAFYLRFVPQAYVPFMERDEQLVLYEDWFVRYMHAREKASFFIAWLLQLHDRGVRLVNPPQAASVLQYKPFQLHVLRSLGAQVPRTLITNDPGRVREFHAEYREVIFKPVMGGALTRMLEDEALANLDALSASPVIFQERVRGEDLRIMVVGQRVVSSVAIVTPEQKLDFRGDDHYTSGQAGYREVPLPESIAKLCVDAARGCGLAFAGIDIKHQGDDWVFLELNSSPIYLDVERKLGHPISAAIAKLLVEGEGA